MPGMKTAALPTMIGQPLRDMLRGVAVFADLTEDTLAPAARLLPDPIRSNFRSVLTSLENAGARVVSPGISHRDIVAAAAVFTTPHDHGYDALTNVLAYAWDRTAPALTERRLLFSEVVAARSLAGFEGAADHTAFQRAAHVYATLRRARPVSVIPALDMPMRTQDEARVALTIFAFLVWLVSDRAASLVEENRLLDLAIALTLAKEDQIGEQLGDTAAIATRLEDLAKHL